MNRDAYRFLGFVLVTIVGLIGAVALLHLIVKLPIKGNEADWIAAIGTVATLFWAIWLATQESRRRREGELVLARLHAAAMINRIELAYNSVRVLVTSLNAREDVDRIEEGFYQTRLDSINALSLWEVSELVPLVPLPHETAAKLAQAADQLHFIKRLLSTGIVEPRWASKVTRESTRRAILGRASVVMFQLRDAEIECKKARVTVSATPPA